MGKMGCLLKDRSPRTGALARRTGALGVETDGEAEIDRGGPLGGREGHFSLKPLREYWVQTDHVNKRDDQCFSGMMLKNARDFPTSFPIDLTGPLVLDVILKTKIASVVELPLDEQVVAGAVYPSADYGAVIADYAGRLPELSQSRPSIVVYHVNQPPGTQCKADRSDDLSRWGMAVPPT
jgi:hypothetical protein